MTPASLRKLLGRTAPPGPSRAEAAARIRSEGNAHLADGRLEEAAQSYAEAAGLNPDDAANHLNLGYVNLELGRDRQALESLQRAAVLDPAEADVPYLIGRAHLERGRLNDAEQFLMQAVSLRPAFVHAWVALGKARSALGNAAGAIAALESAVAAQPDFPSVEVDLANALLDAGRNTHGLHLADRAIATDPNQAAAHLCRSRALHALERLEEALQSCDHALGLAPADPAALHGRGVIMIDMRRFAEALQSIDAALAQSSDASQVARLRQSRSVALGGLCRYEESLIDAQAAVDGNPSSADSWRVLANAFKWLGRYADALAVYAKAIERLPQDPDVRWDESMCRLLLADFRGGWPLHEWRLRSALYAGVEAETRSAAPRWQGDTPIAGRRMLLHAEQGLGDVIQFVRYLPLVLERGADVVLQVPRALVGLMQQLATPKAGQGGGHLRVIANGEPVPAHDLRCSLLSLPAAFKTDIDSVPASVPYFSALPELGAQWRARLAGATDPARPRIGLVWSGNPKHCNDHNRSIPLARLVASLPAGIDLVALQPEVRPADRAALDSMEGVRDFGPELRSFNDTAALLDVLDLIISVDTSVAHLAGAMGRPLFLLLPHDPDWRWMLARTDTPWYPSCRLIRQHAPGNWDGALDELRAAVMEWRAKWVSNAATASASA